MLTVGGCPMNRVGGSEGEKLPRFIINNNIIIVILTRPRCTWETYTRYQVTSTSPCRRTGDRLVGRHCRRASGSLRTHHRHRIPLDQRQKNRRRRSPTDSLVSGPWRTLVAIHYSRCRRRTCQYHFANVRCTT